MTNNEITIQDIDAKLKAYELLSSRPTTTRRISSKKLIEQFIADMREIRDRLTAASAA
jgi:hypothetical protein